MAKLFLVDLGALSGLPRVIAFLGVGVLLLVIGFVSPLPPAARSTRRRRRDAVETAAKPSVRLTRPLAFDPWCFMSGNTLGTLFCVTSFGESHGPAIGCVVDGCPPGLSLAAADIQRELDRRKPGTSRHVTQRRESDTVEILSGVFEGRTTGTPIALLIRNEDPRSKDYAAIAETFRPGHADYAYWQKYGIRDYRGGGRASARETAVRVAAGAIARKWLAERHGVRIRGHLVQLGPTAIPFEDWDAVDANPFFVANAEHRPRAGVVHGRAAQVRRFLRREDHRGRDRRAGRMGRARLRPARRRSRAGDDGHQRGQGCGDRRPGSRA